jgi:hypothetical protein
VIQQAIHRWQLAQELLDVTHTGRLAQAGANYNTRREMTPASSYVSCRMTPDVISARLETRAVVAR